MRKEKSFLDGDAHYASFALYSSGIASARLAKVDIAEKRLFRVLSFSLARAAGSRSPRGKKIEAERGWSPSCRVD